MKAPEIFKNAVIFLLEKTETKRSVLADSTEIPRPHLTSYLNGDRGFSEDKRELIAQYFGKTYLEMLNLGHQLATGTEPIASELPVNLKDVIKKLEALDQESLKLISALADKLPKEGK